MSDAAPTPAEMLASYLAAERDILLYGKSTSADGRTLTTADLPEIRAGRQEWEARSLSAARVASGAGSLSVRTAVFRE